MAGTTPNFSLTTLNANDDFALDGYKFTDSDRVLIDRLINVALNHDRYKSAIAQAVRDAGLDCLAPCLRKGDVLLWNSLLVHGSLEASRPGVSRASLTAVSTSACTSSGERVASIRRQRSGSASTRCSYASPTAS